MLLRNPMDKKQKAFGTPSGRHRRHAEPAAIQCPRPVPCSKGQRVRVLPLPSDAGPAAALAASSGPDTEDLRRKSGQPELRCGADSAGIGAAGRKNQPLRRAARDKKGRTAGAAWSIGADRDGLNSLIVVELKNYRAR